MEEPYDTPASSTDQGSAVMYILRMAVAAMTWEKLPPGFDSPVGRWRHTASLVRGTELVVFGGYHTLDQRLNDTWVFDCVSRFWRQPHIDSPPQQTPSPRAAHSAVVFGEMIYIFGGYGGNLI